jgi:hypothetical protein
MVADALMLYVPSLLAMGHGDQAISTFADDLAGLRAPFRAVLIFLGGNAGMALSLAAAREGLGWLDWYTGKLAGYRVEPEVHAAASVAEYLRRERAVTLSMASRQYWGQIVIGHATELARDAVQQAARHALGPWIAAVQSQPG